MHPLARTVVAGLLALTGLQATAEAQARPKADRNKITSEEIRSRSAATVYDLIRSKRPNWLSVRGSATFETRTVRDPYGSSQPMTVGAPPEIIVYVDDVRRGSQEVLRSMSTEEVESIERLDASSATQRFGTGHEHGAILIRRRAR